MAKYILHGGETKIRCDRNTQFFRELVSSTKDGKILEVIYAKPKEKWREQERIDLARFKEEAPDVFFNLDFADEKPSIFLKQVAFADVIYFKGGRDKLLKNFLMPMKRDLSTLFKNKIVAGCSAGANIIAAYYFSTDNQRIEKGLGFLPIKVHCHYKGSEKNLDELKKYGKDLKVYKIREADFVIIDSQ